MFKFVFLPLFYQLQMAKTRKSLEKEIESKRKSFESYKLYINPRPNEDISVLQAKKSDKEEELKTYYWFSCMYLFRYCNQLFIWQEYPKM